MNNRLNKSINEKESLIDDTEAMAHLELNYQPSLHQPLLTAKEVSLSYYQQLFNPVSFTLSNREQLALIGNNGVGKSSLIRAIYDNFPGNISGHLDLDHQLKISLVRQDYSDRHGLLSAFAEEHQLDYEQLLNTLFKLGFNRETFQVPIEQMSMGQQKRVELAKSLVEPAQLYIWDEPLNYLDTYN